MENTKPQISVIIPVGPAHTIMALGAVHSVRIQHGVNYELVVVNDTDEELSYPGVDKLIKGRMRGPAAARNDGAEVAEGECFVWLDADDLLMPGALQALWAAYKEHETIIYGVTVRSDNVKLHRPSPQYCGPDIRQTSLFMPKRMPTHLIPAWMHFEIGGFDEDAPLWEDVVYEIDMDIKGYCAMVIDYPIYMYNLHTGDRRSDDILTKEAQQYIRVKYEQYVKGVKTMGCKGGCGGGKSVTITGPMGSAQRGSMNLDMNHYLQIEYIGDNPETKTYIGPATKRRYRFGLTSDRVRSRYVGYEENEVHPQDAAGMVGNHGPFRINKLGPREASKPTVQTPEAQEVPLSMTSKEERDMKVNIWAGLPISRFTVKELQEAIEDVPAAVLTQWLYEEQDADSPRKTIVTMLEKKLGVEEPTELPEIPEI